MGSESTAHEAETQLVGEKKYRGKHFSLVKARLKSFLVAKTLQTWRTLFDASGLQHIAY